MLITEVRPSFEPLFRSGLGSLLSILCSSSHRATSVVPSDDLILSADLTQPSFPSEVFIEIPPAGMGDSTSLKL